MKFVNKYGKCCRYKHLDKVRVLNFFDDQKIYTVKNAEWIGNTAGFWNIILIDDDGNKCESHNVQYLRKVK